MTASLTTVDFKGGALSCSAKESIKETGLDIRSGSRPQVARAKESNRSINCATLEEI